MPLKRKNLPAILWLLIVTVLLCLPGKTLPDAGGDWFNRIYADKWIHVFLFAVLVFLSCRANPHYYEPFGGIILQYVIIAVLGVLYGILMEFMQLWLVNGRGFEGYDILADAAGCIAGYWFALRRMKKISSNKVK